MSEYTAEQVQALADAMWQLLDDMGEHGFFVCSYAKSKARLAYEPFAEILDDEEPLEFTKADAERALRLGRGGN